MTNSSPLTDIKKLIDSAPAGDGDSADAVTGIFEEFPGPQPVLGSLQDQMVWLARWQKRHLPHISRPLIAVFAGTHGVAETFMDGDLKKIARQRVAGLTKHKAAIRGIAGQMNAAYKVYEMGVEHPVPNFQLSPTLSEAECAGAIAFGMEVVAEGADIIALGSAGTGSATAAAAIALGLYGGTADYWAGAHDHSADVRIKAVRDALSVHELSGADALTYLRYFGGRDIAGLVGAIVAARHQSIPIILDGFVVCIAAAIVHSINPSAIEHCRAGSLTSEPAHEALLDRIGLQPINNFGVSLGDGTGAALTLQLLQSAASGLKTLKA